MAVPDALTTGILVGSASPNLGADQPEPPSPGNHYGIFLEGVGKVVHASLQGNHFGNAPPCEVKRVVVS